MDSQNSTSLDKRGILKVMFLAILIAFLGIGFLGWQYNQLEKKRIPLIEEEINRQKEQMEQKTAENALDKFMSARIGKNEAQAIHYLTEGAMEQKNQGQFILINNFESCEILKTEKLTENKYRFVIKIYEEEIGDFVEVIILTKILGKYYIDSVAMAG